MTTMNLGILGCGDFLRWQSGDIKQSENVNVVALFDPDPSRAEKYAAELGGQAVTDADAILTHPEINTVALYVPPWIRKDLFVRAAENGKHILATKPLGAREADCLCMADAAEKAGIKCGVLYGRSGDAFMETARTVFAEGRFGKLALYRQDWLHAYPKWNSWATDPEKNGGPFMDAMVHNLNAACYLMGKEVKNSWFFSNRLSHPDLACADTESMILEFEGGGQASLIITWAADLATYGTEGNDREHIDLFYLITDQGWRITKDRRDDGLTLVASREGREETVLCKDAANTVYDAFASHIGGGEYPSRLINLKEATRDIRMVRTAPVNR